MHRRLSHNALIITNALLRSSSRQCSTTATTDLKSQVEELSTRVQQQQVALVALTRKLMDNKSNNPIVASNSDAEQSARLISSLTQKVEELEKTVAQLQQDHNKNNSQVENDEDDIRRKAVTTVTSKQLSDWSNRLAAIESRQAVVSISNSKQNASLMNKSRSASSPSTPPQQQQQHHVVMEPDSIDGTPRLTTCQVRVFHPTADAPDVRQLMESAGPVVSCLRRPGDGNKNQQQQQQKNSSTARERNSVVVLPCFVVTFQSTIDAVRAMENLTGMKIGKHKVVVEPHVLPEQTLAAPAVDTRGGGGGESAEFDDE